MLVPGFMREGSVQTDGSGEIYERPHTPSSRSSSRTRSSSKGPSSSSSQLASSTPKTKSSRFNFFGSFRSKGHQKTPSFSGSDFINSKVNGSLTSLHTTLSNTTNDSLSPPGVTYSRNSSTSNAPLTPTHERDAFITSIPRIPSCSSFLEMGNLQTSLPPRKPPPTIPIPPTPTEFSNMISNGNERSRNTSANLSPKTIPLTRTTSNESKPKSLSVFPARKRQDSSYQAPLPIKTIIVDDEEAALERALDDFYVSDFEYNQKFQALPIEVQRYHHRGDSVTHDLSPKYEARSIEPPSYETLPIQELPELEEKADGLRSSSPINNLANRPTFQSAIAKMENAGLKVMCKRLSEDWSSGDTESSLLEEINFEKRMWGSVAFQQLTHGRSLMSGAHDVMTGAKPEDDRKLLHLHGTAANGWVLATKYPNATIYSVSTKDISNPACSWPAPANHYSLITPSASASLPFPDNHFDVISAKSLPAVLKAGDWVSVLQECNRVLKPGGWLECQTIDPTLMNQGEQLKAWLDTRLLGEMTDDDHLLTPSEDITFNLTQAGFENVKRSRIALPASINPRNIPKGQGPDPDAARLMVLVGQHFYEELYRDFVPIINGSGDSMWWSNKQIKQECESLNSCIGLVFTVAQK